jgi:hypothetical protein
MMANGPFPQPDERLKQLMEYTKFHIGMYATLCTLLIGILGLKMFETEVARTRCILIVVLICFVLAGMFGGLVGSSIPFYTSFDSFMEAPAIPALLEGRWATCERVPEVLKFKWLTGKCCTHLEHYFFWAGIVGALVTVVIVTTNPGKPIEIHQ